jgi:hypothetical protein
MVRNLAMVCLLTLAGQLPSVATLRSELPTVNLIMIDYRFIPDRLIFVHDVHYQLHLENHGKETHELTAPTFFATADIDNPNALNHYRTEIVVQPGETKDIFLTARRPGTYDLPLWLRKQRDVGFWH